MTPVVDRYGAHAPVETSEAPAPHHPVSRSTEIRADTRWAFARWHPQTRRRAASGCTLRPLPRRNHTVLLRFQGTQENRPDSLPPPPNRICWYLLLSTELQEFSSTWHHVWTMKHTPMSHLRSMVRIQTVCVVYNGRELEGRTTPRSRRSRARRRNPSNPRSTDRAPIRGRSTLPSAVEQSRPRVCPEGRRPDSLRLERRSSAAGPNGGPPGVRLAVQRDAGGPTPGSVASTAGGRKRSIGHCRVSASASEWAADLV